MAKSNDKMRIYTQVASTPKEAQRTISAGKLKGMTDVNPMYRIKKLTETFGPQGVGFKFDVIKTEVVEAAGESMASVILALYYKESEESEWSGPVIGVGGSKLSGKGVGDGINDEAFKMAFTDAQSICCKGLGMCHDIYYSKDRTKYSENVESTTVPAQAPVKKSEPVNEEANANCIEFTVEEAMKDFEHCDNVAELRDLYESKYGGNKGLNEWINSSSAESASIAKQIKNIAGAKFRILQSK